MFRQPPLSSVSNIFILPFNINVWISSVILFSLISILLLFQWFTHRQLTPLDGITFILGVICQQGFYLSLKSISGRIIMFMSFMASIFLFTSYSANIVALLQSPSNAIKTISDLINSPMKLIVQDTVYNHVFFHETNSSETKMLFTKKIQPNYENAFVNIEYGVKKIRSGLYSFQVEAHAAYKYISETFTEHEKCGLKELEAFHLPILAVPVRRNFPYRELFSQRLRWQREVGIMNREHRKWMPQKPQCLGNTGGFISVSLTECYPALIILLIGIAISFTFLAIENIVYFILNYKKK